MRLDPLEFRLRNITDERVATCVLVHVDDGSAEDPPDRDGIRMRCRRRPGQSS
jgi:hypothetical protein